MPSMNNTRKLFEVKAVISANGLKYLSAPDLITALDEMKEGQSEEVQKFIGNLIVSLATTQTANS